MSPERLRLLNERFITRKTKRANSWVPPTGTGNDGYARFLKQVLLQHAVIGSF